MQLQKRVATVPCTLALSSGGYWSLADVRGGDPSTLALSGKVMPPGLLASLSEMGMSGIYITFVLPVGSLLRASVNAVLTALPFEECEHNGLLLALCHDIYAARQDGNLEIEWLAYRLLIDIYRSPADLRELTSGTLPGLFSRDHSD